MLPGIRVLLHMGSTWQLHSDTAMHGLGLTPIVDHACLSKFHRPDAMPLVQDRLAGDFRGFSYVLAPARRVAQATTSAQESSSTIRPGQHAAPVGHAHWPRGQVLIPAMSFSHAL